MQESASLNKDLDLKSLIYEGLRYWYLFAIFLVITMGSAVLFIKYAAPEYAVGSKMIISISNNNRNNYSNDLIEGLDIQQPQKILTNEILILQSTAMIKNTIKDLGFNVSYFFKENFLPYKYYPLKNHPDLVLREMYGNVPFEVKLDIEHPQPVGKTFYLKILDQTEFLLNINKKDISIYDYQKDVALRKIAYLNISQRYKFGEVIQGPDYSFKVFLNSNYTEAYIDKDLYFSFNNIAALTQKFKNNLNIEPSTFESSCINITFKWYNIKKAIDFVKSLTQEYLQRDLSQKNYLALTTIEYIDNELSNISNSLNMAEGELQNFRRRNRVMDIDQKSEQVYQQLQNLESQKQDTQQELRFYKELSSYFEENKNSPNMLAPSSMGVVDPVLNSMIQQLVTLNTEKNSMIEKNLQRNSRFKALNAQIEDLKNSISKNIKFYISSTQGSLDEINTNISRYRYEEGKLPQTQRTLLGMERQFNLNNDIYTFLLQKRAEAQITRASNLPDSEIIEPAIYQGLIFPNRFKIFIIALFFGLGIPFTYLVLKSFFNEKVLDMDEIKSITNIRLLGSVFHNKHKTDQIMIDFPLDIVSESFRTIRTNLQFLMKDETHQIILVSSTFSQEGKSFISLNLATSLAFLNKKAIIVGFDLRKSGDLYKSFSSDSTSGISNYLTGKEPIEKFIQETPVKNLDILLSGPPPSNSAELIESERTEIMFKKLRSIYDYVIIDTPPVGPVTDAYMLMKHADVTVFIVRQNFTLRKPLYRSIEELEQKDIKNKCIILNDVNPGKKEYGYYSYYTEDKKKGLLRKALGFSFLKRKRASMI